MHPLTHYSLAMDRIAEDHRRADLERIARQARDGRRSAPVGMVAFRDRVTRLFGKPNRRPANERAATQP